MQKKLKDIHIGTSGWSYEHWKKNFYPEGLPTKKWLQFYASEFSTVEINSTFYHLPLQSTITNWHEQVPKNFLFSVKASRYITHQKRLREGEKSLKLFYKTIKDLKDRMGPILFQLPPSFKMDKERLTEFIAQLSTDFSYVFEFRHDSWYVEEIYDLLSKNKLALCISDLKGKLSPEIITTSFTYIRLHGPKNAYQGSYGLPKLRKWKSKIEEWAQTISVFCYFDNDEKGYAIQDAKKIKKMITIGEQYAK